MEDDTFLIEDAAEYAGMSRRTFERLNIASREEFRTAKDGKQRKVRVYDRAELDRVKTERATPQHTGAVVTAASTNAAPVVALSDLQKFAAMLVDGMRAENQKLLQLGSGAEAPATSDAKPKKAIDFASFKDKLILNFREARTLSGLTGDELKEALEAKRILASRTERERADGKGGRVKIVKWKINRESLEDYCRQMFH